MNYIYDILLNFQNEYYEFFDWNIIDKITHIKKIPVIKISDNDFINIKYSNIKFDDTFLKKIYQKTQTYKKYEILKNEFMCLFCNNYETIGVKINKKGKILKKSSLLLNESDEILRKMNNKDKEKIEYTIIMKSSNKYLKTRKQQKQSKKMIEKIYNIFNKKEYDKLNYLYYECFGIYEKNIDNVLIKILEEIKKCNDNYYKINNFFNIINQKKIG